MKKAFLLLLFLGSALSIDAQAEMADTMRAEGKIYTLVAIVVAILLGLIGYLVVIDRKVGRLEKRVTEKEKKK